MQKFSTYFRVNFQGSNFIMNIKEFDYELPKELIAQRPVNPRDHSRLLVINRDNNCISHDKFFNILKYLKRGDLLVLNDSKVFPARLIGFKEITHGNVEILLNHQIDAGIWQCVGKNLRINLRINFTNSKLKAVVLKKVEEVFVIKFNMSGERFFVEVNRIGLTPLPPYIKKNVKSQISPVSPEASRGGNVKNKEEEFNRKQYQTVYAKEVGSVAAPTAGLHFTKKLIEEIKKKGIKIEYLTLHVGLGTFAPVKSDKIEKHKIHREFYSMNQRTLNEIIKAKLKHRRIIAVGTTTTRVLETLFQAGIMNNESGIMNKISENHNSSFTIHNSKISGWTNIFIYPGYKFKCIDGLITNFHLPKSTLLMLVSAFSGQKKIKNAYKEAIKEKYRFYSYGDAMFIE